VRPAAAEVIHGVFTGYQPTGPGPKPVWTYREDTRTYCQGGHSTGGASAAVEGQELGESADKPGSVADNHSSGMCVTTHLKRPTRPQCGSHLLACAVGGLFGLAPNGVYHAADCYQPRGALLPHPFTLTCAPDRSLKAIGGLLSAALSVGSRPPGVTWRPTLWSPDFPPPPDPKAWQQRLPG